MPDLTMATTVPAGYEPTVERVRALLADAGFGVLTEIDVRATLSAKLGVDTPPRVILGACRPELAHRALEADPQIAAMLPCNVVVTGRTGRSTLVEVLDPAAMTSFSAVPELVVVAQEARERLAGLIAALDGSPGSASTTESTAAVSAATAGTAAPTEGVTGAPRA